MPFWSMYFFVLLHTTVLVLHRWYTGGRVKGEKGAVSFLFTNKGPSKSNPFSFFCLTFSDAEILLGDL